MTKIILKKGKGESLKRFHPWVFSGAVNKIVGEPAEGDVVDVYSHEGDFMGCGHYQIGSITVRILSFEQRKIDSAYWEEMLGKAYKERCALGLAGTGGAGGVADSVAGGVAGGVADSVAGVQTACVSSVQPAGVTNAYRLVHGEGDNLPGLIVDIYDNVAVMQAHSVGMFLAKEEIAAALVKVYGGKLVAVYDKSSGTAPFKAGLDLCDSYLYKADGVGENAVGNEQSVVESGGKSGVEKDGRSVVESGETVVLENGCKFLVNWLEGQKTGFFLDQRDNRDLVRKYSAGKNVLNLFCYTGGFSIYALHGGAVHVDSVDSSKKAIELVRKNVLLNGFTDAVASESIAADVYARERVFADDEAVEGVSADVVAPGITVANEYAQHDAICTDAIEYMRDCEAGKYDLMIVDPPAFAKHRGALDNALRAYKKLNALAIEKIAPGGIIFTYSCSQVVDKYNFALAIFSAAAMSGRNVRILHRLTQPADHPVNIYHPEGEYLKGLVLYVE